MGSHGSCTMAQCQEDGRHLTYLREERHQASGDDKPVTLFIHYTTNYPYTRFSICFC